MTDPRGTAPAASDTFAAAGAGLMMIGALLVLLGGWNALEVFVDLPTAVSATVDAWWAVLLVLGGAWVAAQGRRTLGVALVLLGGVILAVTHLPSDLIWPALVIGAGVVLLVGGTGPARRFVTDGSGVALFTDREPRVGAGGPRSLVAVFGEVVGDLGDREADGVLECFAVFGTVELVVPDDVAVEMRQTAVFGDVRAPEPPRGRTARTVRVRGTSVFGDVRVRRG